MPRNLFRGWRGWGFVVMMKKEKELLRNIRVSSIIAIISFILSAIVLCLLKVYVAPNMGWEIIILAIGLILSLILGVLNMFNFFKSIDAMEEANIIAREANEVAKSIQREQHAHDLKLLKLEQEYPKQEAKRILKRHIEDIMSCWEDNKEYHLKSILDGRNVQNELRELGNKLKESIVKDGVVLSQTIVVKANRMVDATMDLATSLRPQDVIAGGGNLQIYQEAVAKGDKLVEQARELIEKLESKKE